MSTALQLNFEGSEPVTIEISRAIEMRLGSDKNNKIFIEQLSDGTYRLCWTAGLMSDITKLQSIDVIRKD